MDMPAAGRDGSGAAGGEAARQAGAFAGVVFDRDRLRAVAESLGLRLVVAFGSRVTGRPPPDEASDLDLAVLATPESPVSIWTTYQALTGVFADVSLDLVVLNEADPLLRWEVMRSAALVYGASEGFLEYRAYAFRDFVDSADLRRLENAMFRKKMKFLAAALHATA